MADMRFFATAPKGVEPYLAAELRALGIAGEEGPGGVAFSGELEAGYRACLWSRLASRVLVSLDRFSAPTPEDLYAGVQRTVWSSHFSVDDRFAVHAIANRSQLQHEHFIALKIKDAIVDQFRVATGDRPSIDVAAADIRLHAYLFEDQCELSLDLSGESLHRRGYRRSEHAAPLKENLAAALLLAAEWPKLAKEGWPVVDPMCGSGTLLIEAALIALGRAPSYFRQRFGFSSWRHHDETRWNELRQSARPELVLRQAQHHRGGLMAAHPEPVEGRSAQGERLIVPPLYGFDSDATAIADAKRSADAAGVSHLIHFERRALDQAAPPEGKQGMLITNPPYGERLSTAEELVTLYETLGNVLRQKFLGWTAQVLAPHHDLSTHIGLRSSSRKIFFNGPIECRLLEFRIHDTPPVSEPRWRQPIARSSSEMFENRLRKNLAHRKKWAQREKVFCYRVYDADLPEYAVAVDFYDGAVHVQEYQAPKTVNQAHAEARLRAVQEIVPRVFDLSEKDVFFKIRRRQRPTTQYGRHGESGDFRPVREADCKLLVNLADYLDTGLFLDHRRLRAMVADAAKDKHLLNLFAYTCSATVLAAKAGVRSTVSVDLSQTYLDWGQRNLELNHLRGTPHQLVRADCMTWLASENRKFDVIFLSPPTFSNSKRMEGTFDVERDHVALIGSSARLLRDGGTIFFSNHFRRFKMAAELEQALVIENITPKTIPFDFDRDQRIHNAWKITRR